MAVPGLELAHYIDPRVGRPKLEPLSSPSSLRAQSMEGAYLRHNPATNLRHIRHPRFEPSYRDFAPILGELGLELVDQETRKGVAVCSFDVVEVDGHVKMRVGQTPQGYPADAWSTHGRSKDERHRFMTSSFRQEMIAGLIVIGKDLDAEIEIVSAMNHPKVRSGEIDMKRGYRIIDEVAQASGFEYNHDLNLILHP